MKTEIKIDGKTYILKSSIKEKETNFMDYLVVEQCNVMGIYPNKEPVNDEFYIKSIGDFKEYTGNIYLSKLNKKIFNYT